MHSAYRFEQVPFNYGATFNLSLAEPVLPAGAITALITYEALNDKQLQWGDSVRVNFKSNSATAF
jgi:hypothetical protein